MTSQLTCNFETADGTPCQNPVGPGTTACSAGHPVTTSGSVAAKPVLTPQEAVTRLLETFDTESILGLTPATTSESEVHEPESELAMSSEEAALFIANLSEQSNVDKALFSHEGCVDGIRPRLTEAGTAAFHVERFRVASATPFVLALGDPAGSLNLHVEVPCTEEICSDHAYIRLAPDTFTAGTPEERTAAFATGVVNATAIGLDAKCPAHRLPIAHPADGAV